MNSKNIKIHLNNKLRDWIGSIGNEAIKNILKENVIVTGGAITSLLTEDEVRDYDVYFRTKESCLAVTNYYVDKWNEKHPGRPVSVRVTEETGKIVCFVRSVGVVCEENSNAPYNYTSIKEEIEKAHIEMEDKDEDVEEKYRPIIITSNAITLSDKVQIVIRFYGEIEEIHKNYDFAHCTCAWSSWDDNLSLPGKALECIINKELYYVGSKYPLCSIIRTRKYLERGYHIDAGQYVKMCMQLNKLDLANVKVLEDQLTGVDTIFFQEMINVLKKHTEETGDERVDTMYVISLINELF